MMTIDSKRVVNIVMRLSLVCTPNLKQTLVLRTGDNMYLSMQIRECPRRDVLNFGIELRIQ